MKLYTSALVATLLIVGCSDNKTESEPEQIINSNIEESISKLESTKDEIDQKIKETTDVIQGSTAETTQDIISTTTDIKETKNEIQTNVSKTIESSVKEVAKEIKEPSHKPSFDAKSIFSKSCASCHGSKAEKVAMNTSAILTTMSESDIKSALHGYKNGTYGKNMKALMQGQVKAYSVDELDALATYIASLK